MKIEELNKSDKDKALLRELETPKTIAQVAAILNCTYSYASMKLMVLLEEGFVKKQKAGKKAIYFLNQDVIELESGK